MKAGGGVDSVAPFDDGRRSSALARAPGASFNRPEE
jgi:hypothetical protein